MEDTKAIAGTVVVENPRTGEILALANRPNFNPNVFNSVPTEALKNRAVSDIYEPGSVFKIVTYSAAIDQHLVTPDDKVDCQHGSIDVFGMKIHDHESLGVITIAEALAHSSDVAAIKVGMKLGQDRLYQYLHRLRLRTADWDRTARRNSRHGQDGESLVEGFYRRNFDGTGDRRHSPANHFAGIDDRQ